MTQATTPRYLLDWYTPTDHPQDDEGAVCVAHGLGGRYSICDARGGVCLWYAGDEFTWTAHATLEEAKALAEDDFNVQMAKVRKQ